MPRPEAEPRGFPQPSQDGYVAMSPSHKPLHATTTNDDDEPLWTQDMDSCITVATYNIDTKLRSLCHLPGGQYESLVSQLAGIIDESTLVIFTNGTSCSQHWLESQKETISSAIVDHLAENGREGGMYRIYYTDPDKDAANGLKAGTFVIQSDGKYGRIQAAQNQAQGQSTSRGLPGGDSRGSQGKNGKRGFWRKLFCCCSCCFK